MPFQKDSAFYEAILDLFPGMVSVVSPDFRVLYANQVLKERCGEDPVGKLCYRAFHGLEEVCPWCKMEEVLREKKTLLWEVESPKDKRWYEVRSIPFKQDEEWFYLSVITDITEKKKLEQSLKRQLRFFQEILEKNPALILFNQEGRLTFVNRTFEEITGIPREEALGKNIFELFVPEEDLEPWRKHCEEVHCGIFKKDIELPVRTRKGDKRYLLWNCMRVEDPEGRPTVVGLAIDITEEKHLFEQYLQAQKMESLGRFTGVILHELNNLFMAIQGYLGVAQLKLEEPEKVKEYLQKMEGLLERWRKMSRDLLSFARKSPATAESLDLARFLHTHEETFSHLLGSKIQLEVEAPPEGLFAEISPVHLQQILFNLISNAREAMPEGGRVRLKLEEVVLAEEAARVLGLKAGPYLLLTFEDQGPGIPEEILPHIFEPYFTTKESGTGLGLATVYSLVKQYQGHIAVYSALGKGTTFCIYFPKKPSERNTIPKPSFIPLLVVEEEVALLETIQELLQHLGYRPYTAAGFQEARELIAQGLKPEVLMIDIRVKSGKTAGFIRELRKQFPDLKLIITSGYREDFVRENLPGEPFYYLPKPFTLEELDGVLKRVLSGE